VSRLAFVSTMGGFPWGGSEALWADAARAALADGHQVLACVHAWPETPAPVSALAAAGATLVRRPPPAARRSFAARLRDRLGRSLARRSDRAIERVLAWRPDVIVVSQGHTYEALEQPGLGERLAAAGVPYVLVCQLNSDLQTPAAGARARAERFLAGAARLVFVAEENLRLAERQLGRTLANARVLRNPVHLARPAPLPWPARARARIACVARLDVRYKGQDLLLEALAAPAWRARDLECRLYGAGPDRAHLARLLARHGLAGRVRLMGHVADVAAVWRECHLLALPSRAEGTPLALVEAMLCARPALVTDVGGNGEWIEEPDCGFVAAAATVRSLAGALERAWVRRADWRAMGARAHRRAAGRVDPVPGRTLLALLPGVGASVASDPAPPPADAAPAGPR